jgi:hypothetical protein
MTTDRRVLAFAPAALALIAAPLPGRGAVPCPGGVTFRVGA